jgi:hypothetical protein
VTGSKSADRGVQNAMLRALYEVVRKAGENMGEVSRSSIIGLLENDSGDVDGRHPTQYGFLLHLTFLRCNKNHERKALWCFG